MQKDFLDETDMYVYKLLEMLTNHSSQIIPVNELKSMLNLSSSKFKIVLERLTELCKKYPFFTIKINKNVLYFYASKHFLLSQLYSIILEETIYYTLIDLFFYEKFISLEKVSKQYFFSSRTIQRKLEIIKSNLENYNLQLNLKSNFIIQGEEYRIRYFFHIFYWQKFDGSKPMKVGINEESRQLLKNLLSSHNTKLRNIDIEKFTQIVSISFYRLKNGYHISDIPKEMLKLKHAYITYSTFKHNIMIPVSKKALILSKLDEKEFIFLYYMFCSITTYLLNDVDKDTILTSSIYETKIINKIINETEKEFKFHLTNKEKIYVTLNLLVVNSVSTVFSSRKKIDVFGKNTTELEYFEYLPKDYSRMKSIYQKLAKHDLKLQELYNGNQRIIFQYSMIFSLITPQNAIKIFHESKFGKIQQLKQRQDIIKFLNNPIQFVTKNPDIVLTDYPVNKRKYLKKNPNVKFFYFHTFSIKESLEKIKDFIDNNLLF